MLKDKLRIIFFLFFCSFMFVGPFCIQVLGMKAPVFRQWTMYRQNIPVRFRFEIIPNKDMFTSSSSYKSAKDYARGISNKYRRPRSFEEFNQRLGLICNQFKLKKDAYVYYLAEPTPSGWNWLKRNTLLDCSNLT